MPRTDWGWLVTAQELAGWILHHDEDLLVVDKPAHVVCHPSKHGPWSSLVGACREYLGVERLHLPSRLDRETSGVVVVAKTERMIARLHLAKPEKIYHAILRGELREAVTVDQPIGKVVSKVAVRRGVVEGGQAARTDFEPLAWGGGKTLARVTPHTGRTHQIRVHAAWLGHAVAGDKIYGPDENLFLEFVERGWTGRHQALLAMERHALHASVWEWAELRFQAPLPADWKCLLAEMPISVAGKSRISLD